MKVGDLGQFKQIDNLGMLNYRLFFVSKLLDDDGIEITLFHNGETLVFDFRELHYYADAL